MCIFLKQVVREKLDLGKHIQPSGYHRGWESGLGTRISCLVCLRRPGERNSLGTQASVLPRSINLTGGLLGSVCEQVREQGGGNVVKAQSQV